MEFHAACAMKPFASRDLESSWTSPAKFLLALGPIVS